MDQKDLIFMASEAGFGKLLTGDGLPSMWHGTDLGMLELFAGLVATAEREACAKACDDAASETSSLWEPGCWAHAAGYCAHKIKMRANAEITGG